MIPTERKKLIIFNKSYISYISGKKIYKMISGKYFSISVVL